MSAQRTAIGIALAFTILPAIASDYLGKGPDGHDNGAAHACTGTQPSQAAVICVRAGAASGGNGAASTPLSTINAAIAAAKAGDIVQVAAGTYLENVALGAFNAGSGKHLTLLGGFNADFSARDASQYITTINGGDLAPAVALHVQMAAGERTTLDGFTLTHGRGLGNDWSDGRGAGGGVHAQVFGHGEIVISHNVIHANRTASHTAGDTRGGGIHAETEAWDPAFTGVVRIEDNTVRDNLAGKGAGINIIGREAVVLRNLIQDNTSHGDHGGGLYVSTRIPQVRDNVIRGNVVGATAGYGWGGGIIVAGAGADLQGNVITDNHAPSIGSGVFWDEAAVGTMKNDLIFKNRCASGGVAIYIDGQQETPPQGGSVVEIENLTLADHLCPGGGTVIELERGSTLSMRNSILWNNSGGIGNEAFWNNTLDMAWSIAQEPGIGNFHADPLFANADAGDYHLRSGGGRFTPTGWVIDAVHSPAIDAGDPASDPSQETEPNGAHINLGAYGNTVQASRSVGNSAIFADGFEETMF